MSDNEKITVLYIKPGMNPQVIEIENKLEAMQKLVGGHIEEYMPFEEEIALVCNEEGKLQNLEWNRVIYDAEGKRKDIIAGDFFLCYAPIESEKFLSLPKELLEKYEKKFQISEKERRQHESKDNGITNYKKQERER